MVYSTKEKRDAYQRLWNNRNREKRRAYWRKWRSKYKPYDKKRCVDYAKNHPEKTRFYILRTRSRELGMPFLMTRKEFSEWYLKQPQHCHYCHIVDLSDQLTIQRKPLLGFTIDRKDSSFPYTIENICFACWTCNRLKSDVFSGEEWFEIAQKYIKPKWLAKVGVPSI